MIELVELLKKKNLTIGSIESMTGGLFAASITSVPGASKVYKGSIVSYSPLIKENVVGVPHELITQYGVVSKEVALAMASFGRIKLDVDICVSVTGNAGPTAEPGKAGVGATYIGVNYRGKPFVLKQVFSGDREEIRQKTLLAMQEVVLQLIK